MCGIAGLIARDGWTGPIERLTAMRDELRHRGPDDAGAWWSADRPRRPRASPARDHRPLAGRPPADGEPARRPPHHLQRRDLQLPRAARASSKGWAARSRTTSDTEVMLEAFDAWGDRALDELNGMFAFALYDARARSRAPRARSRGREAALLLAPRRSAVLRVRAEGALRRSGRAARPRLRRAQFLPDLRLRAGRAVHPRAACGSCRPDTR